jgi:hypothetical protein
MKKNKRLLLFLIILFPSIFWLILETSTINSSKLLFYGPKTLSGTDTVYYGLGDIKLPTITNNSISLKYFDTINYPLFALVFIKQKYLAENVRLEGLLDYTTHKKADVGKFPLLLIFPKTDGLNTIEYNLKDSLNITLDNIEQCYWNRSSFDSMNVSFFKSKPSHVDYSCIVLLDKKRNIRGYYDARYAAEVKRMLSEYQHLRLREEKNTMLQQNEIKDETPK